MMKTKRAFSPFARRTRTTDLLEEIRTRNEALAKYDSKSTRVEESSAIEVVLEETPSTLALEKYYRKDNPRRNAKKKLPTTPVAKADRKKPAQESRPNVTPKPAPAVPSTRPEKNSPQETFRTKYPERDPHQGIGYKKCTPLFRGTRKSMACSSKENEPAEEESFPVRVTPTRGQPVDENEETNDIIQTPEKAVPLAVNRSFKTAVAAKSLETPDTTELSPSPVSKRCTPSFRRRERYGAISPEHPRIVARIEANQPPLAEEAQAMEGLRRVTSHVSEYGGAGETSVAPYKTNDDVSIGQDSMQEVLKALKLVEQSIQSGNSRNIQVNPKVLASLTRIADNIEDPQEQQAMKREISSWQVLSASNRAANESKRSSDNFQRLPSQPESVDEASFSQILSIEDDAFSGSSYSRSRPDWHSQEDTMDDHHSTGQQSGKSSGWGGRDNPYEVQEIDAPPRATPSPQRLKPPRDYTSQDRSWWRKNQSPDRASGARYPSNHPYAPSQPIQREPSWFEAMSLGSIGSDQFGGKNASSKSKRQSWPPTPKRSLLDDEEDNEPTWEVDEADGGLNIGATVPGGQVPEEI